MVTVFPSARQIYVKKMPANNIFFCPQTDIPALRRPVLSALWVQILTADSHTPRQPGWKAEGDALRSIIINWIILPQTAKCSNGKNRLLWRLNHSGKELPRINRRRDSEFAERKGRRVRIQKQFFLYPGLFTEQYINKWTKRRDFCSPATKRTAVFYPVEYLLKSVENLCIDK